MSMKEAELIEQLLDAFEGDINRIPKYNTLEGQQAFRAASYNGARLTIKDLIKTAQLELIEELLEKKERDADNQRYVISVDALEAKRRSLE